MSEEGNSACLSRCSGGLRPLVELCVEPEELECAFGIMCLQVMVADTGVDEIIRGTDGGETEGGGEPKRRRQKTHVNKDTAINAIKNLNLAHGLKMSE